MKSIINNKQTMDSQIVKVVQFGNRLSFIICLISIFVLLIYKSYYISYALYEIGLLLFQSGLIFAIMFVTCGFVVNKVKGN